VWYALMGAGAWACGEPAPDPYTGVGEGPSALPPTAPGDSAMSDALERAQARVTRQVIDLEGVTGTALGLCDGKPCIKIYLESDSSALRRRLPRSEAGFPVVTEVTGKIRRP